MGVDYVSTLAASLALQGTFAAAVGQLRGSGHSRVDVSLAGAATLAIGQYLAGATAPEGAERLLPGLRGRASELGLAAPPRRSMRRHRRECTGAGGRTGRSGRPNPSARWRPSASQRKFRPQGGQKA